MYLILAEDSNQIIKLFEDGGPLMWGLLVLSILAFVAAFVCLWTTRASAILPKDMANEVEIYIRRKDYTGLLTYCESDGSSFARTVSGIVLFIRRNISANMDAIREVADAEGTRQTNILTRQISWLADIGAIAPMVGLLGTVLGMMQTFVVMANTEYGRELYSQMSKGISEAMITTAGGLILAIPCMLTYVVFRNHIQKHISNMEVAVTHVLSVISVQNERDSRLGSITHVGPQTALMTDDED